MLITLGSTSFHFPNRLWAQNTWPVLFSRVHIAGNMTSNSIASVPKLKGRENYDDWAFAVENYLILDGLKGCIDGTEADAVKVRQAKAKLILTFDPSLYVHIKETTTAEELWKKLKGLFDDAGFTRKIGLLRSLISLRRENCDTMASYVNQVVETARRLRGTGFKIDDEWVGSLLLAGLPEKYNPMIMAIKHSGIKIMMDSLKTKLLDMEIDADNTGNAFIGKFSKRRSWDGNTGDVRKTDRGSVGKCHNQNVKNDYITCYKCKQKGHYKKNCPQKSSRENQESTKNF
ncbi:hypothetical protein JTB14_014801 [Gonioctena quinquepunctata]|nr:hypothetical protein JTB14_014801 [Gonioctena quinquepunctata]